MEKTLEEKTKAEIAEQSTSTQDSRVTSMIEYLSTEIEALTTSTMVYRSKISFAVFIGPFILLGALVATARSFQATLTVGNWQQYEKAVALLAICYLGLAYLSARIE